RVSKGLEGFARDGTHLRLARRTGPGDVPNMKKTSFRALTRRAAATAVLLAAVLGSTSAMAIPELGSALPELHLADAWGRSLSTGGCSGMPVLVIYEDKGSTKDNEALKKELTALAQSNRTYLKRVTLLAVADVSDFNFGLIRGFVRRAIKEEASKRGISIY